MAGWIDDEIRVNRTHKRRAEGGCEYAGSLPAGESYEFPWLLPPLMSIVKNAKGRQVRVQTRLIAMVEDDLAIHLSKQRARVGIHTISKNYVSCRSVGTISKEQFPMSLRYCPAKFLP